MMERRAYSSATNRRARYEEPSMYQLQPPPVQQLEPQLQQHMQQPQQLQPQIYMVSQPQTSNSNQTIVQHRDSLRELANKLGVKNGGHPPGWVEPSRNKARVRSSGMASGSTSNTGRKPNRQLGIRLAQRGFKFSEQQRAKLNEAFELNRYPKPEEMELIAYEINVRKNQVKNWFHDQRRKYKKEEAAAVKTTYKRPMFSAQQRRKLEEFFEKNFHPYPGDSRRIVEDFESTDGEYRYELEPVRYETSNASEKVVQSRGFKFTEEQRMRLRSFFKGNKYPNPIDMERLAHELDVKRGQIKNWFHDQRRKFKRENPNR